MTQHVSRRNALALFGAGGAALLASSIAPSSSLADDKKVLDIADPDIRAGFTAAVEKNILPAASQKLYPGHFTITADGAHYGADSTWPGLDSWQMAGAYLLLGRTQLVLDYFEFVRASQQKSDGNIPWAIFPGGTRPDTTWLSGLKYPDGLFTYDPPKREGVPASALEKKDWMRMFGHWQPKATPLSNLASVCYVLTASEIFEHTRDKAWLRERMPSIELAAKFLWKRKTDNGLIPGSGFYTELPPRHGWDGVSQCYIVHAFRSLAKLYMAIGDGAAAKEWNGNADVLSAKFVETFWREDHFAEYVHIERGLVDSHGLSDTNWAAIAFGVASDEHITKLWPLLEAEKSLWAGGVPTQTVAKPRSYAEWELHEKLPFGAPPLKDASAMGRVWYLEAEACKRVGATKRLVESTQLVCRAANGGYWRERYELHPNGKVVPAYADKYCEYPAAIVRVVLGNPGAFRA